MTDRELTGLAAVAYSEQGTDRGAAAEASLMANRFELKMKGECYGETGGAGLYKYVGLPSDDDHYFFSLAYKYIDTRHLANYTAPEGEEPEIVTEHMKEVVKRVLVDGKRTIPGYIDEHDSWSAKDYTAIQDGEDITYDKNQYVPYETILTTDHGGSHYTFWGWADPNYSDTDALGYTSEENRKKVGEAYYDYETGELINPEKSTNESDNEIDKNNK